MVCINDIDLCKSGRGWIGICKNKLINDVQSPIGSLKRPGLGCERGRHKRTQLIRTPLRLCNEQRDNQQRHETSLIAHGR